MSNSQISTAQVREQLNAWGITDIEHNEALLEYTLNILETPSGRIGDIVVKFGYATLQEVEKFAKTQPQNMLLLEHLADHIDNLRPHTQKLLAANDKLAYYESLNSALIHPDFKSNADLHAFCDKHTCLPYVALDRSSLRLVFADYSIQKDYSQSSRLTRANDPVGLLLQKFGIENVIFSIGKREQIVAQLHQQMGDVVDAIDDEDQLNFWSDSDANTANQKILGRILAIAAEKNATNIKFTPNVQNGSVDVFYRRHGILRPVPNIRPLTAQQADEINRFLHVKSIARYTETAKRVEGRLLMEADGQFVFRTSTSETFLRCNFIPVANNGLSQNPESISLRLLPRKAVDIKMSELKISDEIIAAAQNYLMLDHGLILVVGPTSSGKSTSIAGMITLYREAYGDTKNIMSLEQPIERRKPGVTEIQVHQGKFESGMAALLRHDPDCIFIGEIRDRPSASACVRAANTGSIVLSTLHADDSTTAYNALLSYIRNVSGNNVNSVIVTEYDAISSLALIIAQRLIPVLCPDCYVPILDAGAKEYSSRTTAYKSYCKSNEHQEHNIDKTFLRNPNGCPKCDHEGLIGEVPINEYLPVTKPLRKKMIAMANSGQNDLDILASHRPFTLYQEVMELVLSGKVSVNDALI